jgi:ABC-type multidrug transport system fused ATPase/permease subunit
MTGGAATFMLIAYFRYFNSSKKMDPGTYFAFYQIFNIMKNPAYLVINGINFLIETQVSINRFNEFLTAEEVDHGRILELGRKSDIAVKIVEGDFQWKCDETRLFLKMEESKKKLERKRRQTLMIRERAQTRGLLTDLTAFGDSPEGKKENKGEKKIRENLQKLEAKLLTDDEDDNQFLSAQVMSIEQEDEEEDDLGEFELKGVNLEIKKGEKVIVFGESSQGKSSLLYCMLGEMIAKHGNARVMKSGKVAFLAQARWLIGDTIRENITMGKKYDQEWMDEALKTSCLVQDLTTLNNGMDTVLGDTSDTVSGGQRARIALARCFYQK